MTTMTAPTSSPDAPFPAQMQLRQHAEIFEAAAKEGEKTRPMRIRLYSGQEVHHWGTKTIVDLAGLRVPAGQFPVLANHDHRAIVGYAEEVEKGERLTVSGRAILESPEYQTIARNVAAGFRYQASMGFAIERWERIEQGGEKKVNGRRFSGPGYVITQSRLLEASVVPIGADGDTATALFSVVDGQWRAVNTGDEQMSEAAKESPNAVAAFAAAHPEAVEAWKKEGFATGAEAGRTGERKRMEALKQEFGADPGFVVEQFEAGADVPTAAVAFHRRSKVLLEARDAEIARLKAGQEAREQALPAGSPRGMAAPSLSAEAQWETDAGGVRAKFACREDFLHYEKCRVEGKLVGDGSFIQSKAEKTKG